MFYNFCHSFCFIFYWSISPSLLFFAGVNIFSHGESSSTGTSWPWAWLLLISNIYIFIINILIRLIPMFTPDQTAITVCVSIACVVASSSVILVAILLIWEQSGLIMVLLVQTLLHCVMAGVDAAVVISSAHANVVVHEPEADFLRAYVP